MTVEAIPEEVQAPDEQSATVRREAGARLDWLEKMRGIYGDVQQHSGTYQSRNSRDSSNLPGYIRRRNNIRRGLR